VSAPYEVVVVGAGLAGACAAALLGRQAGLDPGRVALLEAEWPAPGTTGSAPELRVAALSRASEHVLRAAGAWHRLDAARLCAYERMCVWHETTAADGPGALHFDAADIGEPDLGHIAEMPALQRACIESFREAGGRLIEAPLTGVTIGQDAVRVQTGDATLETRLLVGADGAQSAVRQQVGLGVRTQDYHQRAIVATVGSERPHAHTAWQRFLHSGPLALLPLFGGSCSIVWSVDEPLARPLLECTASEFGERLTEAVAQVLGSMQLRSERLSFPLRSLVAGSYVVPRCALIGDAAHVIHPLAGQGANLGVLDAAALCEAVAAAAAEHEDTGALRILRGYEQQRRTHNRIMDAAMSAFRTGFAVAGGPMAWVLNQGLAAVDRSPPLKRAFARAALGLTGELPRFARGSAAQQGAA
jgi:2-octaprenylphenol hydroxylase